MVVALLVMAPWVASAQGTPDAGTPDAGAPDGDAGLEGETPSEDAEGDAPAEEPVEGDAPAEDVPAEVGEAPAEGEQDEAAGEPSEAPVEEPPPAGDDEPPPGQDPPPAEDEELFVLTEEELEEIEEAEAEGASLEEAAAGEAGEAEGDAGAGDEDEDEGEDDVDEEDLTLREVVVVGYQEEDLLRLGGSAQTLGQEQLEQLEYDDPHSVLLQVPGVYVRTEDGFGLRPNIGLRGGNPERSKKITLMEDGVLFGPAPYAAPAAYYFPLMTRMVGVEVFKGPSALLYGPQTIGGALNLLSRTIPTRPEGGMDLSWGLYNTRKLHLHYGASNRWGGFLFEALDVASDGFKEIDSSNRDTGFHRSDFMLRGFLQTDPDERLYQRLELKLGFQRERSNETYLGLSDADFEADPNRRYAASADDRMKWWRTQVQLTWRLELGERFQMVTDVYRHDLERSWLRFNRFGDQSQTPREVLLSPTGVRAVFYDVLRGVEDSASAEENIWLIDNARRFVSQGGQTRARLHFETGVVDHDIEVGLRFHQDEVRREHTEYEHLMRSGELVPTGDSNLVTDNLSWAFAFAGYLTYGIEVAGLTLSPGVRTEVVKTRGESGDREVSQVDAMVLPGLGANYRIAEHLSVLAGVHRGFSPVSLSIGPPEPAEPEAAPQPETSISYEAGVRYQDGERGRHLELVGFVNDYQNLTGTCTFSSGCTSGVLDRQFEGGEVLVWGVEAVASWTFEAGDFAIPLRLTYTYTGSRFQSSFSSGDPTWGDVREGDALPYVPEHQGQLQAGLEHEVAGGRVVATYVGEMREEAGQGDEGVFTDDYVMVDVVAWWQTTERLRVYTRAENVLNQQPIASRRPFGARPTRPFTVYAGVKVDF
ncbi:MAG: ligand-gated channel protein [Sandaracinus sp.]|nr:ligand-gated channel protein [Sandaracinus sp.]